MNLICSILGHDAVGEEDVPWGVRCARCGKSGYHYGEWIDAGPVDCGSDKWGKMTPEQKQDWEYGGSK